jgi:lipoprotein-anchoring transpeptidase ErfK/SrfK
MSRYILGVILALATTVCAHAQTFQQPVGEPLSLNPAHYAQYVPTKLKASPQFKDCAEPKAGQYEPDTIVVSTCLLKLYHFDRQGLLHTYRIGGARDGFRWSGEGFVGDMKEWPDWRPPQTMIQRELREKGRVLPVMMKGGPQNPLGARALYIFDKKTKIITEYRIHGTNDPKSIGQWMSSGCIRMLNKEVMHLYEQVRVGTKVIVLN